MTRFLQTLGLLLAFLPAFAQKTLKLAPPFIQFESIFFEKQGSATLEFAKTNTQIRYTTNGQNPTETDRAYTKPIVLKKRSSVLKARVFGEGFQPSETIEATFYKAGFQIDSIATTLPHQLYPGSGSRTLIDRLGGRDAFNSKTWMGFSADTVSMELWLDKPVKTKQIMLHVLENQGAWIYLPQKVEVYTQAKEGGHWELISQTQAEAGEFQAKSLCKALWVNLKQAHKTQHLLIKAYPLANIPDSHPGKGNRAWLFIDEINIY